MGPRRVRWSHGNASPLTQIAKGTPTHDYPKRCQLTSSCHHRQRPPPSSHTRRP